MLIHLVWSGILIGTSSCGIAQGIISIPRNILFGPQPLVVENTIVRHTAPPNNPGLHGATIVKFVFRVSCSSNGSVGTGFLHKTGVVITAAHVISDCQLKDIQLTLPNGSISQVTEGHYNKSYDLGVLTPSVSVDGWRVINISSTDNIDSGEQVTTWGFPEGYDGAQALATIGYIAGQQDNPTYLDNGQSKPFATNFWIVNAAINGGHSGSPVFSITDGSIVGIVIREQEAWTPEIDRAIGMLAKEKSTTDRTLGTALNGLRQRSQYNIGYIVPANAIRNYLIGTGVSDP